MPKRTDIKSILIIGAGPIIIGQACEFDYSGTQACKALREEGYKVILVNSNPATIMTDPDTADVVYVEPITPEMVAKIIAKERPDALLPTMGGQTALNTALALEEMGVLEQYNVEMIGAKADVIDKAEDRERFRTAMDKIGLGSAKSRQVGTVEDALDALDHIGLPAIIRPSFTMGGTGGGIAYNIQDYKTIVKSGLKASPVNTVLVEESLLGWKEYEMEVVRDSADNCIIICSIENFDPMGVHTGDSITVAPALTLTDKEYQVMRDASLAVLREIGVETGGSNVQFAVNPDDGRLIVIEMNPRVSRSSALASKATGFPIAKVAAKLAVGYTLDELDNDITKTTPASFEPTIDYVVTKIPRFTFEKFPQADDYLTTAMKSVGESMAIGRTFKESMQKALRSLETGLCGFDPIAIPGGDDTDSVRSALSKPTSQRVLYVAQAFRLGWDLESVWDATRIDRWFLRHIQEIVETENTVAQNGLPTDTQGMHRLKRMGFSDKRLSQLVGKPEKSVFDHRHALNVRPVYKRVDTCGAEFPSETPYMYSCYAGDGLMPAHNEAQYSNRKKVVVLGGGPNRIGQGIEFDYCCVHACFALSDAGYETIMVNCNPETVSTDYDTSDVLYFEPLTGEDVVEIIKGEQQNGEVLGVIVQFGGQTPLKLSQTLEEYGIPILGTSPDSIDLAEDRERFQTLLNDIGLKQPPNGIATSEDQALAIANRIGYPVVIRPSYVLGGRAMEIVHDDDGLKHYMATAVQASGDSPVLVDYYLKEAIEVDADALCDGESVHVAGILEHVEEAGIHSGDSACSIPPHTLSAPIIADIKQQCEKLALALKVKGLMNVQFAIQGNDVYILEVNPRASRTVPFVAKAVGSPIAKIASRLMAGEKLSAFAGELVDPITLNHFAVKESIFPFARFPGVDAVLGPEMRSTGEVMGIDKTFAGAFAKSQMAVKNALPTSGTVYISVQDNDKPRALTCAKILADNGFTITASRGTAQYLSDNGITVTAVNKVREASPNISDMMINGDIDLLLNTTSTKNTIEDSTNIRQLALRTGIPYFTTTVGAMAAADAIAHMNATELNVLDIRSIFQ